MWTSDCKLSWHLSRHQTAQVEEASQPRNLSGDATSVTWYILTDFLAIQHLSMTSNRAVSLADVLFSRLQSQSFCLHFVYMYIIVQRKDCMGRVGVFWRKPAASDSRYVCLINQKQTNNNINNKNLVLARVGFISFILFLFINLLSLYSKSMS